MAVIITAAINKMPFSKTPGRTAAGPLPPPCPSSLPESSRWSGNCRSHFSGRYKKNFGAGGADDLALGLRLAHEAVTFPNARNSWGSPSLENSGCSSRPQPLPASVSMEMGAGMGFGKKKLSNRDSPAGGGQAGRGAGGVRRTGPVPVSPAGSSVRAAGAGHPPREATPSRAPGGLRCPCLSRPQPESCFHLGSAAGTEVPVCETAP